MRLYKKPEGGWTENTIPKIDGFYWAQNRLGKKTKKIIIGYGYAYINSENKYISIILACGQEYIYNIDDFDWFYGPIEPPEINEV